MYYKNLISLSINFVLSYNLYYKIILFSMHNLDHLIRKKEEKNLSIKLEQSDNYPFHHHKCQCQMCSQYEDKIIKTLIDQKAKQIQMRIQKRQTLPRTSEPLIYLLKKLMIPSHKIIKRGIKIYIPEVCFYKDGEANSLFMNTQIGERVTKQTENFNKILVQYDQILVSRIRKQKLTNTQLQKIFNERRRKYRQKIVRSSAKRRLQRKDTLVRQPQGLNESRDAIIIRYTDGYEQMKSQNQFINMMLRRKQDPFFKKIDYIKNFIDVTQEQNNIFYLNYFDGQIKYEQLFKRSKTLMRVYGDNITQGDRQFIDNIVQERLNKKIKKQSIEAFVYYQMYKIIAFVQYFYDEKIIEMSAKFLLNECGELYLIDVFQLKKIDLVKYAWNNQTYAKKIKQNQNAFIQKPIKLALNTKMTKNATQIEATMKNQYESLKKIYGLSYVQQNDNQLVANNNFFAYMYPQLKKPISEILKDHKMTVECFQAKYLGRKKVKRPVASNFNSNLVQDYVKMGASFKSAKGHEIQNKLFPKMGISNRSGNRSFSMKDTITTLSKTLTYL